jgi:outer membrane lipoprotein-sorting protein
MNRCWFILVLTLTLSGRAAELTNAHAVLEFVLQKNAGYKTFTADFTQTQLLFGELSRMTGALQFHQPAQTRMTMRLISVGGATQNVVAVMGDDQILWQETTSSGPPTVMKLDMTIIPTNHPAAALLKNPFETVDPQRFVARLRTDYLQTLTGDGTLHGQPMYILEGVLKPNLKLPPHVAAMTRDWGRQRLHIGQTDGFVHQVEQFDKTDTNLVMAIEFTNLRFNPDLPADLFRYAPPSAAHVIDMSAILLQMKRRP